MMGMSEICNSIAEWPEWKRSEGDEIHPEVVFQLIDEDVENYFATMNENSEDEKVVTEAVYNWKRTCDLLVDLVALGKEYNDKASKRTMKHFDEKIIAPLKRHVDTYKKVVWEFCCRKAKELTMQCNEQLNQNTLDNLKVISEFVSQSEQQEKKKEELNDDNSGGESGDNLPAQRNTEERPLFKRSKLPLLGKRKSQLANTEDRPKKRSKLLVSEEEENGENNSGEEENGGEENREVNSDEEENGGEENRDMLSVLGKRKAKLGGAEDRPKKRSKLLASEEEGKQKTTKKRTKTEHKGQYFMVLRSRSSRTSDKAKNDKQANKPVKTNCHVMVLRSQSRQALNSS